MSSVSKLPFVFILRNFIWQEIIVKNTHFCLSWKKTNRFLRSYIINENSLNTVRITVFTHTFILHVE